MKKDISTLAWLAGTLAVLFLLSLLLDIMWFRAHAIREILVYVMMALAAFVAFKNIKELNK